jgi:hypothetical protein
MKSINTYTANLTLGLKAGYSDKLYTNYDVKIALL